MTWRISRFPVWGSFGSSTSGVGFPLFVQKVLQYRFGIDANKFLAKSTIEEIDIARMNTEAIVHHREMTDAPAVNTIDRQHDVRSIKRMKEMGDDTFRLLSRVDLPCFILFIYDERAIRGGDAEYLRLPGFMNDPKTCRCCPHHAAIRLRQSVGNVTISFSPRSNER
jgi:hypothetical protein